MPYEAYESAIDVLVEHLDFQYSDHVREGIVRVLTCKQARGKANSRLLRPFESVDKDNLRFAIGNALAEIATPEDAQTIEAPMRDKKHGSSRAMIFSR